MPKKIEIYPNNEVAYIVPPEPIDENEPICLADYFIPRSNEKLLNYDRMRRFGEDTFTTQIGGTTYEVSTPVSYTHLDVYKRQKSKCRSYTLCQQR